MIGREIGAGKLLQFVIGFDKEKLHQVGGYTERLKLQQLVGESQISKMHQPGAEIE